MSEKLQIGRKVLKSSIRYGCDTAYDGKFKDRIDYENILYRFKEGVKNIETRCVWMSIIDDFKKEYTNEQKQTIKFRINLDDFAVLDKVENFKDFTKHNLNKSEIFAFMLYLEPFMNWPTQMNPFINKFTGEYITNIDDYKIHMEKVKKEEQKFKPPFENPTGIEPYTDEAFCLSIFITIITEPNITRYKDSWEFEKKFMSLTINQRYGLAKLFKNTREYYLYYDGRVGSVELDICDCMIETVDRIEKLDTGIKDCLYSDNKKLFHWIEDEKLQSKLIKEWNNIKEVWDDGRQKWVLDPPKKPIPKCEKIYQPTKEEMEKTKKEIETLKIKEEKAQKKELMKKRIIFWCWVIFMLISNIIVYVNSDNYLKQMIPAFISFGIMLGIILFMFLIFYIFVFIDKIRS